MGARRSQMMALVLRQSVLLTVLGISIGPAGAAGVTRYLEGMLFGITRLDPPTFIGVALLFTLVAGVASAIPARRAASVNPLTALRHE